MISVVDNVLMQAGVPEDELVACLRWALGDDWASLSLPDSADRLRTRHPAFADLDDAEPVGNVMYRVGEQYIKNKKDVNAHKVAL